MIVKTYDGKNAVLEEDEVVIPNIEKYHCPICGAPPKLDTYSLDKENTPLDHNNLLLRVSCSNKECRRGFQTIQNWIESYEKIKERWWNPPTPEERIALINKIERK